LSFTAPGLADLEVNVLRDAVIAARSR
jgi:hypothetical protein